MSVQYEIMKYCKKVQTYYTFNIEAQSHYYEIMYHNNKVIIRLFVRYNNGIKCDDVKVLKNVELEDFCNSIINIYEIKLRIGSHSDIQLESIVDKIQIRRL